MKSVVFGSENNSPSATAVQYNRINATRQSTWSATENLRAVVVPMAFDLANFYVRLSTAPGAGTSYTFTVLKNSTATSLEVVISDTNTTTTDSTHIVSFAAGDTISLRCTPTNSPAAVSIQYWNTEVSTAAQTAPLLMGIAPASATVTQYAGVVGGHSTTSGWSATESDMQIVVPANGVISGLYAKVVTAPSSGRSWQFTLMKNGSATTLQATVSDTATDATNLVNSFSVAAGDTLTIRSTPAGTPTTSNQSFGIIFNPTVNGESFFGFGSSQTPSNTTTQYEQLLGIGDLAWTATESTRQLIVGSCVIKNMYIKVGTAPGASGSQIFTIRNAGVNTALTTTLSNTNTTGNVISNVSFAQGDFLTLQSAVSGTPNTLTGGVHVGVLVYIAPSTPIFVPQVIAY